MVLYNTVYLNSFSDTVLLLVKFYNKKKTNLDLGTHFTVRIPSVDFSSTWLKL